MRLWVVAGNRVGCVDGLPHVSLEIPVLRFARLRGADWLEVGNRISI